MATEQHTVAGIADAGQEQPGVELGDLRRICPSRRFGLHTAVDTSGFLGDRASAEFLDLVDLFLLDIKAGDEELYQLVTSAELEPTLRFARRLSDRGNRMWLRYVLVPGLTDAEDDVEKVARFMSTLDHVERVEVLPFHQLGAGKLADLRLPYQLAGALARRPGAGAAGGRPVPGPRADRRLNPVAGQRAPTHQPGDVSLSGQVRVRASGRGRPGIPRGDGRAGARQ